MKGFDDNAKDPGSAHFTKITMVGPCMSKQGFKEATCNFHIQAIQGTVGIPGMLLPTPCHTPL